MDSEGERNNPHTLSQVNIAKAMTVTENSAKPIWAADADSYYEKQVLTRAHI